MLLSVQEGADIVRMHDVFETVQALAGRRGDPESQVMAKEDRSAT